MRPDGLSCNCLACVTNEHVSSTTNVTKVSSMASVYHSKEIIYFLSIIFIPVIFGVQPHSIRIHYTCKFFLGLQWNQLTFDLSMENTLGNKCLLLLGASDDQRAKNRTQQILLCLCLCLCFGPIKEAYKSVAASLLELSDNNIIHLLSAGKGRTFALRIALLLF